MALWELHDGRALVGPVDEEQARRMIASGLPESALARPAGAVDWRSLRSYPGFAAALEQRQRGPAARPASKVGTVVMGAAAALVLLVFLSFAWSMVSSRVSGPARSLPAAAP